MASHFKSFLEQGWAFNLLFKISLSTPIFLQLKAFLMKNFWVSQCPSTDTLGISFDPLTLPMKKSGHEKVCNLFKIILLVKGRLRKTLQKSRYHRKYGNLARTYTQWDRSFSSSNYTQSLRQSIYKYSWLCLLCISTPGMWECGMFCLWLHLTLHCLSSFLLRTLPARPHSPSPKIDHIVDMIYLFKFAHVCHCRLLYQAQNSGGPPWGNDPVKHSQSLLALQITCTAL